MNGNTVDRNCEEPGFPTSFFLSLSTVPFYLLHSSIHSSCSIILSCRSAERKKRRDAPTLRLSGEQQRWCPPLPCLIQSFHMGNECVGIIIQGFILSSSASCGKLFLLFQRTAELYRRQYSVVLSLDSSAHPLNPRLSWLVQGPDQKKFEKKNLHLLRGILETRDCSGVASFLLLPPPIPRHHLPITKESCPSMEKDEWLSIGILGDQP